MSDTQAVEYLGHHDAVSPFVVRQWVATAHMMPPDGERVLVYMPATGRHAETTTFARMTPFGWWPLPAERPASDVTHWMKAPAPPTTPAPPGGS